jgi:AraC-like DNA-binding protein
VQVSALLERRMRDAPMVLAVRECLQRRRFQATVGEVAAELGCSVRTLQRQLKAQATTFERERQRAALDRAKELLSLGTASIKRVALETGFSSPSRLSEAFQRDVGSSPSAWQAAHSTEKNRSSA